MQALFPVVSGLAACVVFALPSLLAIVRKHPNWVLITAVNVVLGATIVGWIAALVWVMRPVSRRKARPRKVAAAELRKAGRGKLAANDSAANDNMSALAVPRAALLEASDDNAYEAWLERGEALSEVASADADHGGRLAPASISPASIACESSPKVAA